MVGLELGYTLWRVPYSHFLVAKKITQERNTGTGSQYQPNTSTRAKLFQYQLAQLSALINVEGMFNSFATTCYTIKIGGSSEPIVLKALNWGLQGT